jgi:hypothetical protein
MMLDGKWRLVSIAPRDHQSDVIMLLVRAEPLHVIENGIEQRLRTLVAMTPQAVNQPLFSEFLAKIVERLGDTIGVKHQCVSWQEGAFLDRAIPLLEEP